MVMKRFGYGVLCMGMLVASIAAAQPAGFNYDEAKVPSFELPDPLVMADGTPVTTAELWTQRRRPEILSLFEAQMYGRSPRTWKAPRVEVIEKGTEALGGKAIRKQLVLDFSDGKTTARWDLLIYLPAKAARPVPMFLGLNFNGNHTIHPDPAIRIPTSWVRANADAGTADNRATEAGRGTSSSRWPVEMILERGYGLATMYYGDIDPDQDDGFRNGIHPIFYQAGQERPAADEWGSIAAWAWGLSRVLDYFETDPDLDHQRTAVMGHSRLGKTSLWAGATDPRFAIVISNNSGCGGAALSRRRFGETVARINTSFPHWFCDNFVQYNGNEDKLPIDQHQLIALMAPRPVYIASAVEDLWADPRGEFLSGYYAAPVYRLLGQNVFSQQASPAVDQPVMTRIGYHLRAGKHDVTDFDWKCYLDFADLHYGRK